MNIPNHVGIIVDGNGRWAKERGKARSEGHLEGAKNIKKMSKYIFSKGVNILSLYVFSTENFKREQKEVDYLMKLFIELFNKEKKYFAKENVKVIFSGTKENLSSKVIDAMDNLEEMTKDKDGKILNFCLNYGSRKEIVDASKKIINDIQNNRLNIDELDEKKFSNYLYQQLPDIDLLIRTSGEQRLSNFMLWQCSYSELYFPKVYFPDFKEEDFDEAIEVFNHRERRFGGNSKNDKI